MKILQRYVLREFLTPYFYCLSGFTAIYVLFELFGSFSRLMEAQLPLSVAVKYFLAYLSPYIMWLVPAALMLATLYTMWNLCRHCEIVAMRSNGVSFFAITGPLLLVAVLSAAAVAFVNERYVPENAQWAKTLRNERFDLSKADRMGNIVYSSPDGRRVWVADGYSGSPSPSLLNVKVTVDSETGTRMKSVTAAEARYLDGEWWFVSPSERHYGPSGEEIASPLSAARDGAPSMRVYPEFYERPGDILMQNRDWRYSSSAGKFRQIRRTKASATEDQKRRMKYDVWAQVLSPVACIVMTLFAIPAGISSSRQSVFKGIAGALAMFFAFYALFILCMVAADGRWLDPVLAAFLPHAVFLAIGWKQFRSQR